MLRLDVNVWNCQARVSARKASGVRDPGDVLMMSVCFTIAYKEQWKTDVRRCDELRAGFGHVGNAEHTSQHPASTGVKI